MKKLMLLFGLLCMLLCASVASAEVVAKPNEDPLKWQISMMPEPSAAEKEAARWSVILENKLGIYAYDMESMKFVLEPNGTVNKDLVNVTVKMLFKDKELLKKMQEGYAKKLKNKEKPQYCLLEMVFDISKSMYATKVTDVYGSKGSQLEHTVKPVNFIPVPEQTFAQVMLEEIQKVAGEEQGNPAK